MNVAFACEKGNGTAQNYDVDVEQKNNGGEGKAAVRKTQKQEIIMVTGSKAEKFPSSMKIVRHQNLFALPAESSSAVTWFKPTNS